MGFLSKKKKFQRIQCEGSAIKARAPFESLFIESWLRTFFQRLTIPDPTFASVAGEFEILREFERVDWTSIFAQATEHAAA